MPNDIYTQAQEQVLLLLAPLLDTASPTPGPLTNIVVQDWESANAAGEDVFDFIRRYNLRTPCGVLSPPTSETFKTGVRAANARSADSTISFGFIALIPTLQSSNARRDIIYQIRTIAVSALADIEIPVESGVNYQYRPIELGIANSSDWTACAVWTIMFSIPTDTTLVNF